MKIERVNDHQIRCTLTKKELEKRDLKLSEMSYGNEKVKQLFQDMMQMAAYECDFEAEDTPLMIEVIPFTECAVIIVTKVEDPDELDTRFSRFAPSVHDGENTLSGIIGDVFQSLTEKNEDIAELFRKVQQHNDTQAGAQSASNENETAAEKCAFFEFSGLNEALRGCQALAPHFTGCSTLYKNTAKNSYILYIYHIESDDETFARTRTLLSEYGEAVHDNGYYRFYAEEHCKTIIREHAVEALAGI